MLRYENGEPVTNTNKDMHQELWYSDYSTLMEWHRMGDTVDELYRKYIKDYKQIFKKECPNKEQILRWSVMLVERMSHFGQCLLLKSACPAMKKYQQMFKHEESGKKELQRLKRKLRN